MRVFVAGASGAIGSRLVRQLIDAGHEVIGTHISQEADVPIIGTFAGSTNRIWLKTQMRIALR